MNDNLPELLAARMRERLPGSRIGSRFVPEPGDVRRWQIPSDARPAAVLILLYPRENRWHLPLARISHQEIISAKRKRGTGNGIR